VGSRNGGHVNTPRRGEGSRHDGHYGLNIKAKALEMVAVLISKMVLFLTTMMVSMFDDAATQITQGG